MPAITCQPSGRHIQAPAGAELLAALRQGGVEVESPCGGKGTCGKCIVRIAAGEADSDSLGMLSGESVAEGYVLACRTRLLDQDLTVEIPEQVGLMGGKFADTDETHLVRKELLPKDADLDPLAIKWMLTVAPPQLEGGLSDVDRLTAAIQDAWGLRRVTYPLATLRNVADALRADGGLVTVTLIREPDQFHIIRIEPGDTTTRHFGLAVDLGTTTIAVQLIDLTHGTILATRSDYNAQITCGLDVISRINYARHPERRQELRVRVLNVINRLLRSACQSHAVDPREVCNAVVSGNTTMIHLLLGLNPEYIRLHPYTPTILQSPYLTAGEVGLDIDPDSWIYFSPAVGSYVGGDITAGILCTDLAADTEQINLFVDIGTNGELVVGNRDFLMTCACSAGPAFEGAGIECGMRASLGAIESVEIDPASGIATYTTIGNVKPRGLCGSGMIDCLANLRLTGWIDPGGRLDRTRPSPAIMLEGKRARYILVPANASASGKPITISETDIDNIIRAKAAIYSACALMIRQLEIQPADLAHIYIAGGFGRFLDLEKAIAIGLLPDIPREKFHYLGNAALTGSYMVAVSQRFRERQNELARRMTYVELNSDPGYMNEYTAALFLPHTDLSLFPSAEKKPPLPSTASPAPNHQHEAHAKMIARCAAELAGIDLATRCAKLGLPLPNGDGSLRVRIFKQDLRFSLPTFDAEIESTHKPAALLDRMLLVRYLLCDLPVVPTGQLISFRELSGGQFYWEPFRKRSLNPLLARIGNDINRLRGNLDRFQWQPMPMGDLGARIHVLGQIDAVLVYQLGDEEMAPAADLLFDACIKRPFAAEEAAAIAGRICFGIM